MLLDIKCDGYSDPICVGRESADVKPAQTAIIAPCSAQKGLRMKPLLVVEDEFGHAELMHNRLSDPVAEEKI
jgi:hypothetical protein